MTISLCMIVKNEEAILSRCLDSLHGLMDEIIIVDTGSTDRTKEIAAKYTDRIYDFPWNDNFSDARNFAFSKATMDYIYSADADEVIDEENRRKFQILKQAIVPEVDIVQMLYTNQLSFNTTYNFDEELRPKLFKRLRTFLWEDPLHETVRLTPVVYDSDIKILHLPTGSHQDRDFSIFHKIINSGTGFSPRLKRMYARELFVSGSDEDFIDAIPHFSRFINEDSETELILMDAAVLSKAYRLKDDTEGMLLAVARGLASGNVPSELVFELGEYYRGKRDYKEAVMWYYNAAFETESLLNAKYHDAYPFIGLHICYVIMGDRENAARFASLGRERERA